MDIIVKKVSDLIPIEYTACLRANYGEGGYMKEEFIASKMYPKTRPGFVIMLWDGPQDTTKNMVGWALLTPVRMWGLIGVTPWAYKRAKYTAQLWVKTKHRRKGYGTVLMNEVKKHDSRPHVFPHDKVSGELFSGFNVQVLKEDKGYLRPKPKVA